MLHYIDEFAAHRKKIPAADFTLEWIRVVLFKWLGVKDSEPDDSQIRKVQQKGFPTVQMTGAEIREWQKAGCPSLKKWLPQKRKQSDDER